MNSARIFKTYRFIKKTALYNKRRQRVEKGVNIEKWAVLHAEETSRNRAGFSLLRGRTYIGTPYRGPQKVLQLFGERRHSGTNKTCRLRQGEWYAACADEAESAKNRTIVRFYSFLSSVLWKRFYDWHLCARKQNLFQISDLRVPADFIDSLRALYNKRRFLCCCVSRLWKHAQSAVVFICISLFYMLYF